MPWTWGLMLGFIISAVSPAVVVPSLFGFRTKSWNQKGYSNTRSCRSLFDDVLSISGFGICLGLCFSQNNLQSAWDVLRAPTEVIVGIVGGIVIGLLCASVGHNKNHSSRCCALLLCSLALGDAVHFTEPLHQRHHLWRCCRPSMGQG